MSERILIYCQHTLGLGHLIRTLSIAGALTSSFDVTVVNGGVWPNGIKAPKAVRVIDLPPLRADAEGRLESVSPVRSVEETFALRRELLAAYAREFTPDVLIVELYPFGRKKFASEILALIERCRASGALILCSVRDILVRNRQDQQSFDDRVCKVLNREFDAVLVHGDPSVAPFEASFQPSTPLRCSIHYTGYIDRPDDCSDSSSKRHFRVLVSAGGGRFASKLRSIALDAAPILESRVGLDMTIVAGPLVSDAEWQSLSRCASNVDGVELIRHVPDLRPLLRRCAVSVSQCGYNTFVDLLATGTPALVVPFEENAEDEQVRRAVHLESRGLAKIQRQSEMTPTSLCNGIIEVLGRRAQGKIDLKGGTETIRLLRCFLKNGANRKGVST